MEKKLLLGKITSLLLIGMAVGTHECVLHIETDKKAKVRRGVSH
jgi:hypothetical protein